MFYLFCLRKAERERERSRDTTGFLERRKEMELRKTSHKSLFNEVSLHGNLARAESHRGKRCTVAMETTS